MAATSASNKTEIDALAATAQNLGQATTRQAGDITRLTNDLNTLKIARQNKAPAKPPPVFDSKKYTFQTFSNFAKNYFTRTGADPDSHVGLLLTYLSPSDYTAVSRVYNMDELSNKPYEKAVDAISHIISDKIDRSKAVSRLLKIKQGNSSIQEFINKLSEMAEIGFPEENMETAKQRCLNSALQNNVRSKLLSYEIHRYLTENPTISFEELSLKVLELEQVLAGENSEDEDPAALNVLNVAEYNDESTRIRRCFVCRSTDHLQRDCPEKLETTRRCYVCRSYYHLQRDCPQNPRNGNRKCYECQSPYHLWRDCPHVYQQNFSGQYDQPNDAYGNGNNRQIFEDRNLKQDSINLINDDEGKGSIETGKGNEETQLNFEGLWEN